MPKKSTKYEIELSEKRRSYGRTGIRATTTTTENKHYRSIHIGVTNGKRWILLKKRLNLTTDADLAGHLLDLAENSVRQKKGCANGTDLEPDHNDKGSDADGIPVPETQSDETEEPLRRSPRKQLLLRDTQILSKDKDETDKTQVKNDDVVKLHARRSSRNKHHKSKTKHHKTKRKKRRRSKSIENNLQVVHVKKIVDGTDRSSTKIDDETMIERTGDACLQQSSRPEATIELVKSKTEDIDKLLVNNIESTTESILWDARPASSLCNGNNAKEAAVETPVVDDAKTLCEEQKDGSKEPKELDIISADGHTNNGLDEEQFAENKTTNFQHDKSSTVESKKTKPLELCDSNRKVRKKRKRSRADIDQTVNNMENKVDNLTEEHLHKHRRKKHKHVGDHKNKKHHDVRKAPQNGIVAMDEVETLEVQPGLAVCPAISVEVDDTENSLTEPQRLAIKITLCQECNSRHLQDACPLSDPKYTILDSITFSTWLNDHHSNSEIQNASNSKDPMSEGYDKPAEDGFDSDDEQLNCDQSKSGVKVENEEKLLNIDKNKPIYARDSLPSCFELKVSTNEHGLGVYAKSEIPMYSKLGPLVGMSIREMDIPDDFPMRHIWETDHDGKICYISTTNPLRSNWIRYMRPADTKEERSVIVVTKAGELHLITTRNILPGTELTYWANSQSTNWTRKNKMDKTNCGGCNLNFAHPIYYRLHCCIFHDTNYSLTIRKYHCKICGAAVLGKDNIMKHAAELHAGRGAYQCQYCKKFFLRLNYLEMHRTYGCAQNPQRARPLCDFCGRKFCQPQKLKVHIKRMHSDMSEVLREFQCKLCLKLLGSRAALQRHMKEVHHKDVVGAATCDRCGKMFQNKSNLKIHMLTHSGVKPFKCKENSCKAAFTTKQCLQFHYKKVHGLSEDMMPKIERSVAYTFDAYSGGLIEDTSRRKVSNPIQNTLQDNSNSSHSVDDCSSENDPKAEDPNKSNELECGELHIGENAPSKDDNEQNTCRSPSPELSNFQTATISVGGSMESIQADTDLYVTSRLQSKGSKKWMGEFNPPQTPEVPLPQPCSTASVSSDVYEFEERKEEEKLSQALIDDSKLGLSVYRRTESSNASLLVEAALDAAERDIGAVSSPILEDNDRDTNLYSISTHLQSPMPQRTPEAHLDSYIQQQELMSPAPTPDNRHTPPNHLHMDYHLHRPVEYINARAHNIEQYLHHEDLPRDSPPNNYIHVQELVSPGATPNSRYQDVHHHHQVPTDNLSSDEGESVAQNLSLSVKEKSVQLDLSTSYKYDTIESEFARERTNFEPLLMNTGELQGLDMSARSFHHAFGTQMQNARYHHHLYEITDRQSVDLSRTGGYSISPPPPAPPYPHSEVLRVVSLDLTPGGRHSVDLTLPRSHHLHGTGTRIITSPQPPSISTPHVVPDAIDSRILSPPPTGYNPTYPLSPAAYHPPRPGYHHYSGYY